MRFVRQNRYKPDGSRTERVQSRPRATAPRTGLCPGSRITGKRGQRTLLASTWVLAKGRGQAAEGAAPAERAGLAFQSGHGGHANTRVIGQRLLRQPALLA